jgi:uncharacterized membrane protein YedE/YeeE
MSAGIYSAEERRRFAIPSLADRAWPPYVAGILVGLLQIPAFLLAKDPLGASTSYATVAAKGTEIVDPAINQVDYMSSYISGITDTTNSWEVAIVIGIALGAYISSRLSGMRRSRPSPIWARALGSSAPSRRYVVAFIGGFIMIFGARLADGCPTGHGISGLAQLAVSSMIAVTGIFIGGALTANFVYRRL